MLTRHKYLILAIVSALAVFSRVAAQPVHPPENNIPASSTPNFPTVTYYPHLQNLSGVTKHNYVRTRIPDQPTDSVQGSQYYRQVTDYFDGLGRPWQTVVSNGHADNYDIVQHYVYDSLGYQKYRYLPFAVAQGTNKGKFVSNVLTGMQNYYPPSHGEHPYGVTELEPTPEARPQSIYAPGTIGVGSDKNKKLYYGFNFPNWTFTTVNSFNVPMIHFVTGGWPRWSILHNDPLGTIPTYHGDYAQKSLSITKVIDENDSAMSAIYTDFRGRKVISTELKSGNWNNTLPTDLLYTCYVYDDLDRLRVIIPPKAAVPSGSPYNYSFSLNSTQLSELCYQYNYDHRNRPASQKMPGKGVEYFVYDDRDRLVFYQDGNMRDQSKWQFTIYDALDRPLITGLLTSSDTRAQLIAKLTQPGIFLATSVFFHLRNYQTWAIYPSSLDNAIIHSYTYYDNYNELPGALTFDAAQFPAVSNVLVTNPVLNPVARGMITGTKVRILDPDNPMANNWITTALYYDSKGRPIQTQTLNHRGGKDILSSIYYFQGTLFKSIQRHENPLAKAQYGANDLLDTIRIEKTYTRNFKQGGGNDLAASIKQKINGSNDFDLVHYSYDHMNRVTVSNTPAAMTLFEYYVHGGLKRINARNNNNAIGQRHIFEEILYYDTGFTSRYYNGNIAGIKWKKAGDNTVYESYGYSYDKVNQLTHAEYRRSGGSSWINGIVDYTVSGINYDQGGNILSMKQRGMKPGFGSPITMDSLTYSYTANSNRLVKVEDAIHPDTTIMLPDFKNGANTGTEYTYDLNGNMKTDANKKITGITYNHLDKPVVVNFQGGKKFTYVYDAMGNLLQKKVYDGSATELYDYLGNFVYLDSTLQYFTHEEGRCRPVVAADTQTGFAYDYFIKDHLGNVRTTVTATEPVTQGMIAVMELASANVEELVFGNIAAVRENKPFPTVGDVFAAQLDATDPATSIGPSILLQLMPGDQIGVSVDAYYDGEMEDDNELDFNSVIGALHNALTGGNNYGGIPMAELPDNVHTVNSLLGNPGLLSEMENITTENASGVAPKAFLNMLVFDGDMNFVQAASRRWQVDDGGINWHTIGDDFASVVDATDGSFFVLIFVNNTSLGKKVWFDDLRITLHRGKVLEENHYYPHGLAITHKAAEAKEQPYKYQGISLERRFGYEMYETFYRSLDPQIGRFWQVDPKAKLDANISPYAAMRNNPIIYIDPTGEYPIYFITRSYAPFETFGPDRAWHGDNRGHTLDKGASYRTMVSIMHDTELRTTEAYGGRSRSYTTDGKKDAYSPTYVRNRSKDENINVHSYGGNEAQFGAPDIDQFTKVTANIEGNIKKDHILHISGTISGDNFPNQESMIYDSKGNTLWLGNFETTGDRESGPVKRLWGSGEKNVNINIDVRIKVNSDGVFQGVMQGKKMISIEDWNKQFE